MVTSIKHLVLGLSVWTNTCLWLWFKKKKKELAISMEIWEISIIKCSFFNMFIFQGLGGLFGLWSFVLCNEGFLVCKNVETIKQYFADCKEFIFIVRVPRKRSLESPEILEIRFSSGIKNSNSKNLFFSSFDPKNRTISLNGKNSKSTHLFISILLLWNLFCYKILFSPQNRLRLTLHFKKQQRIHLHLTVKSDFSHKVNTIARNVFVYTKLHTGD